jgi:hypothetical protein
MQLGRMEMIDQSKVDHIAKISKIQEAETKAKVNPDDKYKNELRKSSDTVNEVMLDNVKFGFNEKTKEFFVRVSKGELEYQFPTEDMMKLKQTLMEAYRNTQK